MNNLNVLKYGYYKGFRQIPHNIKQFFRNIKYAHQRVTRGYCDWDVWSLDTYYAELISASLLELAEVANGYPGTEAYSDEQAKEEGFLNGYDKWSNTLIDIADHFINTLEDTPNDYQRKADKLYEEYKATHSEAARLAWLAQEKKHLEFRVKEKNLALDMLKDFYFDLWD